MDKDDTGTAGEHTRRIGSSGDIEYLCGDVVVISFASVLGGQIITDECVVCGYPFDSRRINTT